MAVLSPGFGSAMVADRKGKQLPVFTAPSRRNWETKKKSARGFLRRLSGIGIAHAVQASRSKQNAAMGHVAECRTGASSPKGVKEGEGGAGNL